MDGSEKKDWKKENRVQRTILKRKGAILLSILALFEYEFSCHDSGQIWAEDFLVTGQDRRNRCRKGVSGREGGERREGAWRNWNWY